MNKPANTDLRKQLEEILNSNDIYEKDGYDGQQINVEYAIQALEALFTTELQKAELRGGMKALKRNLGYVGDTECREYRTGVVYSTSGHLAGLQAELNQLCTPNIKEDK